MTPTEHRPLLQVGEYESFSTETQESSPAEEVFKAVPFTIEEIKARNAERKRIEQQREQEKIASYIEKVMKSLPEEIAENRMCNWPSPWVTINRWEHLEKDDPRFKGILDRLRNDQFTVREGRNSIGRPVIEIRDPEIPEPPKDECTIL